MADGSGSAVLSANAPLAVGEKPLQTLYDERLGRYVTTMRNAEPDMVPLRPFAAEVTAVHAGYSCQQVTHDYNYAFDAVLKCCRDYDWDAVVPNMVYVWTGLSEAIGLRYYGVPGIHVDPDVAFQYREPDEQNAFMKRDEYDQLIEDPVRFLYEVWLPRVSSEVDAGGFRRDLSMVKGGMAMLRYFSAFGPQVERMRLECGTPSSICGMLKAPLDILADKLRGYLGLAFDLMEIPDKVHAACEALMPHLGYIALTSADPTRHVPIPIWMHRGCTPFISKKHFETIYWPTLRPIVESLWAQGNQTLFYAEGKWDAHLEAFATLPAGSIIYHIDRSDPQRTLEVLGDRFCLSGGVPNTLLAFNSPEEVRAHCRMLIETLGKAKGGYIMDASAIMQNDARLENLRAMTDATREFGRYRSPSSPTPAIPPAPSVTAVGPPEWLANRPNLATSPPPGICRTFGQRMEQLPGIKGDRQMLEHVWNDLEGLAYTYIWHVLLSF